jgi:YD repeat-containing protein
MRMREMLRRSCSAPLLALAVLIPGVSIAANLPAPLRDWCEYTLPSLGPNFTCGGTSIFHDPVTLCYALVLPGMKVTSITEQTPGYPWGLFCNTVWPLGGGIGVQMYAEFESCPPGSQSDGSGTNCITPIDLGRNAGQCHGGAGSSGPFVSNPINIGVGNKFQRDDDFTVGILRFSRHYNSQVFRPAFGLSMGWSHSWSRWISLADTGTSVWIYREDGQIVGATLVNTTVTNGLQQWTLDAFSGHQLFAKTNGSTISGWLLVSEGGEIETYDSYGRLLALQSSAGRIQDLTYSDGTSGQNGGYEVDASGNPTATILPPGFVIRVSDDFGRQISLNYDTSLRLAKVIDGAGQSYLYAYDANSNLASVTYPDGHVR